MRPPQAGVPGAAASASGTPFNGNGTVGQQAFVRRMRAMVRQQLAALDRSYPAWRVSRPVRSDGVPGGWWAVRREPLTIEQRAAGLVPSIARRNAVDLVMELAVQDDIARQLEQVTGES